MYTYVNTYFYTYIYIHMCYIHIYIHIQRHPAVNACKCVPFGYVDTEQKLVLTQIRVLSDTILSPLRCVCVHARGIARQRETERLRDRARKSGRKRETQTEGEEENEVQ